MWNVIFNDFEKKNVPVHLNINGVARPIFPPGMKNTVSDSSYRIWWLLEICHSKVVHACTLWRDMYGIATNHCKQYWCLGSDLWLFGSLHWSSEESENVQVLCAYTSVWYENELEISTYKEAKCTTRASQYHIQTELIYSTSLVYRPFACSASVGSLPSFL